MHVTERKRNDRIVKNWRDPTRQEILYLVAKPEFHTILPLLMMI